MILRPLTPGLYLLAAAAAAATAASALGGSGGWKVDSDATDLFRPESGASYPRLARLSDSGDVMAIAVEYEAGTRRGGTPGYKTVKVSRRKRGEEKFTDEVVVAESSKLSRFVVGREQRFFDQPSLIEVRGKGKGKGKKGDDGATATATALLAAVVDNDSPSAVGATSRVSVYRSVDGGARWSNKPVASFAAEEHNLQFRRRAWTPQLRLAAAPADGGGGEKLRLTYSQEQGDWRGYTQRIEAAEADVGGDQPVFKAAEQAAWSKPACFMGCGDGGEGEQRKDREQDFETVWDKKRGKSALVAVVRTSEAGSPRERIEYDVSYDDGKTWESSSGGGEGRRGVVWAPEGADAVSPGITTCGGGGRVAVVFLTNEDVAEGDRNVDEARRAQGLTTFENYQVKMVFSEGLEDGRLKFGEPVLVEDKFSWWPSVICDGDGGEQAADAGQEGGGDGEGTILVSYEIRSGKVDQLPSSVDEPFIHISGRSVVKKVVYKG